MKSPSLPMLVSEVVRLKLPSPQKGKAKTPKDTGQETTASRTQATDGQTSRNVPTTSAGSFSFPLPAQGDSRVPISPTAWSMEQIQSMVWKVLFALPS